MRSRAETWTAVAVAVVAGAAFAAFLFALGVPALRHDWVWVSDAGFRSTAWSSLGGWNAIGIGSPRPYPSDYLLAMVNIGIVTAIGSAGAFLVNAFAIGTVCAGGAIALARRFTDARLAWIGAAAFATFNPWVYNKVVAGHIHMVLAYGAAMFFVAELSRRDAAPLRAAFFALLTMQELQFFVPVLACFAIWTLAGRRNVAPLGLVALCSMPIWIGVLSDRGYLLSIPYTLAWQSDASLDPVRSLELGGYFAKYADALPPAAGVACWVVVALAGAGAIVELIRRRLRAVWIVALAVCVWLFASGTKGAMAAAYLWIVSHVPESGLYRELYDLIGVLAIAYLAACVAAVRWWKPLQWVLLSCGVALLVSWILVPPSRFWVSTRDLPVSRIDAPANSRYALMPPLQPLSYDGRGDGLDPDAMALPGNVVALNTPQFSFPETPALASYAFTGDDRWLRALSVSTVVVRPWFTTDLDTLHMQFALPPKAFAPQLQSRTLRAAPELSLADVPELRALPPQPWEDAVFFGDARGVSGPDVPDGWFASNAVVPVRPNSGSVFAKDGWVDVRTAFGVAPELAQGVGGALTTNPATPLTLDPSLETLADIDGSLVDANGNVLASTTRGYRWLPPFGTGIVRCEGRCAVVAQSIGPSLVRAPRQRRCRGIATLSVPSPWLAIGDLGPAPTCFLRYNVRYDPHWLAFTGGSRLAHVPVDSVVNGWIVPGHDGQERVIMIEGVACAQFVFMLLAACALLATAASSGYALVRR